MLRVIGVLPRVTLGLLTLHLLQRPHSELHRIRIAHIRGLPIRWVRSGFRPGTGYCRQTIRRHAFWSTFGHGVLYKVDPTNTETVLDSSQGSADGENP